MVLLLADRSPRIDTRKTTTLSTLIARRAFGFHSPQALISLAMLKLGGLCPPLPWRVTVT